MNTLNMETKYIDTPEWDKTFALSDKVSHKKVSFTNRYGIRLVGDLYMPKNHAGKLPAIAVDVNEQNPSAVRFYERMGFRTFRRDSTDDQGNPFPILRMKRLF